MTTDGARLMRDLRKTNEKDQRHLLIVDYLNKNYRIVENYTGVDRLILFTPDQSIQEGTPFERDIEIDWFNTIDFDILLPTGTTALKKGFSSFEDARNYLLQTTGLDTFWN